MWILGPSRFVNGITTMRHLPVDNDPNPAPCDRLLALGRSARSQRTFRTAGVRNRWCPCSRFRSRSVTTWRRSRVNWDRVGRFRGQTVCVDVCWQYRTIDFLGGIFACIYLATPFWRITFPLCRCPCEGNPRSRRNNRASSIWRPSLWIWDKGRQDDFRVYFRLYDSFHCAFIRNNTYILLTVCYLFIVCVKYLPYISDP